MTGSTRPVAGDGTESWHGKLNGYTNHHCGCPRCLQAYREYYADYEARHPERKNRVAARAEREKKARRERKERLLAGLKGTPRKVRPADSARLRGETPPLSPEAQKVSRMFDDLKRMTDHYNALRDLSRGLGDEK